MTTGQADPQQPDSFGLRTDGRDLVAEWRRGNPQGVYVTDAAQLAAAAGAPRVLGLFNHDHMLYRHDRAAQGAGEPGLVEMTRAAIAHLSRHRSGYVLMVEGGKIDMAHHASNAYRALDETIEFSEAVRAAVEATSAEDTLIVVTADHSHNLNFVGYPTRGNPILGTVRGSSSFDGQPGRHARDLNGLPYTTLSYANGPGHTGATELQPEGPKRFPHAPKKPPAAPSGRPDLTSVDTADPDYLQEALLPLSSESHGGEDVGIWARGPGSEAFRGSLEQNAIYHVIVQATPRLRAVLCAKGTCDANGVPVALPKLEDFRPR
jgi:alkaline phosphatase